MMNQPQPWNPKDSPPWNTNTKTIFSVVSLFLIGLLIYRFQTLIAPIVLALITAYILHPLISLVTERTRLNRGSAVLLVFASGLITLSILALFLGLAIVDQAQTLAATFPTLVAQSVERIQAIPEVITTPSIAIGPYQLKTYEVQVQEVLGLVDLRPEVLVQQAIDMAGSLFSRGSSVASLLGRGALNALGALSTTFLVLIIAIYMANDIPKISSFIGGIAQQPGYRKDAERLMVETTRIWNAYLRGQVLLGVIIFVLVSLSLGSLQVSNALALGLLSGILEFLPVIGPLIGAGTAILVAFFQEATIFGLSSLNYALVIAGVMLLIQQVENNLLVPRIVGDALDLHPLVVMISVVMGASLAGVLGAVLAAPLVATVKLYGDYGWRKLLDLPPFDSAEPTEEEMGPGVMERIRKGVNLLRTLFNRFFSDKKE